MSKLTCNQYSKVQFTLLVTLRLLIGWHFLYEGISKLLHASWTSAPYLLESKGLFSPLFKSIAQNMDALKMVDMLNTYGLIAVGLGLILGLLTRYALIGGMALLFLYYLPHIPYATVNYAIPAEGSYLWINKNVIEFFAMAVLLVFPTSCCFGLDMWLCNRKK